MVHGEISALSAPGLSQSRFLGAALVPAGGTTGMLYRRLIGMNMVHLCTREGGL